MKKVLVLAMLLAYSTPASAHVHHVAAVAASKASPVAAHHGHHKFICFVNPAGWLICTVVVLTVVDELARAASGPACATGRMTRRSYFGVIRDDPKLWRELCPASRVVSVRW